MTVGLARELRGRSQMRGTFANSCVSRRSAVSPPDAANPSAINEKNDIFEANQIQT
jgi:hypothetical protein